MKVLDSKSCMALAGAVLGLSASAVPQFALAQDGQFSLEEIVVTARKREESLQEVPVAITVFTGNALEEAGIESTRDLFAATPGLNYDTGFDQNAGTPAIRGVVSNEIATYRQKVTTFLDGMPILGQQGSVPFNAIQQVEVLRGPQSAAFGRSTFGGAINYTTVDPGDTWAGDVNVDVGENNLRNFGGTFSGPLIDGVLGGLVSYESKQRDGEADWVTPLEGVTLGGESSKSTLVKLVWTPTDQMSLEYRFKKLDVDNEQTPRAFDVFTTVVDGIDSDSNDNRIIHPDAPTTGDEAVTSCGTGAGPTGSPSCAYVGTISAFDQVFDYNYGAIGIDESFVRDERDRHELEFTYDLSNGGTFQAMTFDSDEYYERATDADLRNNASGFERDPTNIEERYYEIRYASAGDEPFRYGGGVSYYDYDFLTVVYRSLAGYEAGPTGGRQISESAQNTGYFFNLTYDLTEQLTASFEGRYQDDDVTGQGIQGDGSVLKLGQATKTFLPRLALTFTPSDDFTVYAQVAKGNNPAGVNTGMLNADLIAAVEAYPYTGSYTGNAPDIFPADLTGLAFFEEEEVLSFEIGIKGTLSDRMTYALNYYQLDWENYTQAFNLNFEPGDFIDGDVDLNTNGSIAGFIGGDEASEAQAAADLAAGEISDGIGDLGTTYDGLDFGPGRSFLGAGDVTGQGVEFESSIIATDNLRFGIAASWIDITYDSGACSTVPGNYGVPLLAETSIGLPCADISGNEIGTQPQFSAAFSADYSLPLENGMDWFVRWNTQYTSSQYVTEMNLAEMDAYSISDIRTGVSADNWRAEAYATNIFDEDAPQGPQIFHDGAIGGPPPVRQNATYTARRGTQFGVRLSYSFGD